MQNNHIFFLFPKFLEFFLPLQTPLPSLKTLNWTKAQFFLGHPVAHGFWNFLYLFKV